MLKVFLLMFTNTKMYSNEKNIGFLMSSKEYFYTYFINTVSPIIMYFVFLKRFAQISLFEWSNFKVDLKVHQQIIRIYTDGMMLKSTMFNQLISNTNELSEHSWSLSLSPNRRLMNKGTLTIRVCHT